MARLKDDVIQYIALLMFLNGLNFKINCRFRVYGKPASYSDGRVFIFGSRLVGLSILFVLL
jgi:hypothetical protein